MNTESKVKILSVFAAVCVLGIAVLGYFTWNLSGELKALHSQNVPLLASPPSSKQPPFPKQPLVDPWQRMDQMQKQMDQMMNSLIDGNPLDQSIFNDPFFQPPAKQHSWLGKLFSDPNGPYVGSSTFGPSLDMHETDSEFVISIDVPEGQNVDFNTEVTGQTLSLAGEIKSENTQESTGKQMSRRSYQKFSQSVTLPDSADMDKMTTEKTEKQIVIHIPKTK